MKKKEILPMKEVEWLALHCSSTRCNKSFTFEDLKRCHRAKGYAYDCGYHWYITLLLKDLKKDYPNAKVVGHRDFPNVRKECPCLDVASDPDYRLLNLD